MQAPFSLEVVGLGRTPAKAAKPAQPALANPRERGGLAGSLGRPSTTPGPRVARNAELGEHRFQDQDRSPSTLGLPETSVTTLAPNGYHAGWHVSSSPARRPHTRSISVLAGCAGRARLTTGTGQAAIDTSLPGSTPGARGRAATRRAAAVGTAGGSLRARGGGTGSRCVRRGASAPRTASTIGRGIAAAILRGW